MKILVIPDLHGKKTWVREKHSLYDKIIFLWDYCDSFTHSDEEILSNLQAVIGLKQLYPNKVDLLLGNHDIGYIYPSETWCSGHRFSMRNSLWKLFKEHKKLFKICVQYDKYVFSHAGFTKEFIQSNLLTLPEEIHWCFQDRVNAMLRNKKQRKELFAVSSSRWGRSPYPWPLWADRTDTWNNGIRSVFGKDIIQIVGHSKVQSILVNPNNSVIYCDCLDTTQIFYSFTLWQYE